MVRISAEDKAAIQTAAGHIGKSLTTFVTESALKQARQLERRAPKAGVRGVHTGVSSWFRATCMEAAQGGANGYFFAGRKLATSLGAVQPYDVNFDDWADEVEALKTLLFADRDNDGEVFAWFEGHLPKFAALIPAKRRERFLDGVREEYTESGLEL